MNKDKYIYILCDDSVMTGASILQMAGVVFLSREHYELQFCTLFNHKLCIGYM